MQARQAPFVPTQTMHKKFFARNFGWRVPWHCNGDNWESQARGSKHFAISSPILGRNESKWLSLQAIKMFLWLHVLKTLLWVSWSRRTDKMAAHVLAVPTSFCRAPKRCDCFLGATATSCSKSVVADMKRQEGRQKKRLVMSAGFAWGAKATGNEGKQQGMR